MPSAPLCEPATTWYAEPATTWGGYAELDASPDAGSAGYGYAEIGPASHSNSDAGSDVGLIGSRAEIPPTNPEYRAVYAPPPSGWAEDRATDTVHPATPAPAPAPPGRRRSEPAPIGRGKGGGPGHGGPRKFKSAPDPSELGWSVHREIGGAPVSRATAEAVLAAAGHPDGWLVRAKATPDTYAVSVHRGCGGGADHYLIERAVRADGSAGAHFVVNSKLRLRMCTSIEAVIKVLRGCPITSQLVTGRPGLLLAGSPVSG